MQGGGETALPPISENLDQNYCTNIWYSRIDLICHNFIDVGFFTYLFGSIWVNKLSNHQIENTIKDPSKKFGSYLEDKINIHIIN